MLGGTTMYPPSALTSSPGATRPGLLGMGMLTVLNQRWAPRLDRDGGVTGNCPCRSSSVFRLSASSTSRTHTPDAAPVLTARFRLKFPPNHRLMVAGFVVPS